MMQQQTPQRARRKQIGWFWFCGQDDPQSELDLLEQLFELEELEILWTQRMPNIRSGRDNCKFIGGLIGY
jgi:hypothetical protein